MSATTETPAPMFTLDEDAARAWLAAPGSVLDSLVGWTGEDDAFPADWNPRDTEEELRDVGTLLDEAPAAVIGARVPGARVEFTHDDDDYYAFQLVVPAPGSTDPYGLRTLRLDGPHEERRKVGGPGLSGAALALVVLREAVGVGNDLAASLAAHAAPAPVAVEDAPRAEEAPEQPHKIEEAVRVYLAADLVAGRWVIDGATTDGSSLFSDYEEGPLREDCHCETGEEECEAARQRAERDFDLPDGLDLLGLLAEAYGYDLTPRTAAAGQ